MGNTYVGEAKSTQEAIERLVDSVLINDGDVRPVQDAVGIDYVLYRKMVCECDLDADDYAYLAVILKERAKDSIALRGDIKDAVFEEVEC